MNSHVLSNSFAGLIICKEKWSKFCVKNQDRLCYLWDPVQNQNVYILVQRFVRIFKMEIIEHLTKWGASEYCGGVELYKCSNHRFTQPLLLNHKSVTVTDF